MFDILVGALTFAAGYLLCYFTKDNKPKIKEIKEPVGEIRRVKPSLRNPLRTYEVQYEKYKGTKSQLYEPVKPKRKANNGNEVDVDV
jgi:hypothetical protein